MRKKIYTIISASDGSNKTSTAYDLFMILTIVASIVPIAFKQSNHVFIIIDRVCAVIFILDYLLRWLTADFHFQKMAPLSFLRYPFSLMAIIDLVSILPSVTVLNQGFKLLRLLRMLRALRVLRAFKLLRYSKNARIIINVFRQQKGALSYVLVLAVAYILIAALVIFNVEPNSFNTFFDAVYWATVSLTTMGYGDIYPVSTIGRMVTIISSLFGIAIIALPAGIITAGYMDEINNISTDKEPEP